MSYSATDWGQRFMDLATLVSSWSKDPSTKVGAVIVDDRRIVCGVGYNGFPRGVEDHVWRYEDRAVKYRHVVHAEANAILNARGPVHDCRLYCTSHPCATCATLVIQAGITSVVCAGPAERWQEEAAIAAAMFYEAGVSLFVRQ